MAKKGKLIGIGVGNIFTKIRKRKEKYSIVNCNTNFRKKKRL